MPQASEDRKGLPRVFLQDGLLPLGLLFGMAIAAAAADHWQRFAFLIFGALYTLWIGTFLRRLHRLQQRLIVQEAQMAADHRLLQRCVTAADTADRDEGLPDRQSEALRPAAPQAVTRREKALPVVLEEYTDDLLDTPEDREYLQKLVGNYLESLAGEVLSVRHAIQSRNYSDAVKVTHRMKGSAAMYGLPEVSEVAGLLESAISENRDPELLEDLLKMLQTAAATVLSDGGKSHRESWDWSKM